MLVGIKRRPGQALHPEWWGGAKASESASPGQPASGGRPSAVGTAGQPASGGRPALGAGGGQSGQGGVVVPGGETGDKDLGLLSTGKLLGTPKRSFLEDTLAELERRKKRRPDGSWEDDEDEAKAAEPFEESKHPRGPHGEWASKHYAGKHAHLVDAGAKAEEAADEHAAEGWEFPFGTRGLMHMWIKELHDKLARGNTTSLRHDLTGMNVKQLAFLRHAGVIDAQLRNPPFQVIPLFPVKWEEQNRAAGGQSSKAGPWPKSDLMDSGVGQADWKVPTRDIKDAIEAVTGSRPHVVVRRATDSAGNKGWSVYCDTHRCFDFHRDELGGKAIIERLALVEIAEGAGLVKPDDDEAKASEIVASGSQNSPVSSLNPGAAAGQNLAVNGSTDQDPAAVAGLVAGLAAYSAAAEAALASARNGTGG